MRPEQLLDPHALTWFLAGPVGAQALQVEPLNFTASHSYGSPALNTPAWLLRNDSEIPPQDAHALQRNVSPEERDQLDFLRNLSGLPVEYRADLTLSVLDAHPEWLKLKEIQSLLVDLYAAASQAVHGYMPRRARIDRGQDALFDGLNVHVFSRLDTWKLSDGNARVRWIPNYSLALESAIGSRISEKYGLVANKTECAQFCA